MRQFTASCVALLALAGCSSSTAPSQPLGRLIARDSLVATDGHPLPYGAITSGRLAFYASPTFTDTAATPGGLVSAACVTALPSGAQVGGNNLVTLPDGSSYLLIPCSTGTYAISLGEASGDLTISSGNFAFKPDSITLDDNATGSGFRTTVSGATVTVTGRGHSYEFVAVPSR